VTDTPTDITDIIDITDMSAGDAAPLLESPRHVVIDLTNSPHVVFFRPIIRRLEAAGVEPVVTARDYAQTLAPA